MTVAQAEAAAGYRFQDLDARNCGFYSLDNLNGVSFVIINNQVKRIDVRTSQFSTLSGARVGDSKSRILQIYPNNVRTTISWGGGEILTYFPDNAAYQNYRMIFEIDSSGYVKGIRSGISSVAEAREVCF